MKNFDQYVKDAKILVWGLEKKEEEDHYDYENQEDRKNLVKELEGIFCDTEKQKPGVVIRPTVCIGDKLKDPTRHTETEYKSFKQI